MSDSANSSTNSSPFHTAAAPAAARTETFVIPASPSEQDMIKLMVSFGKFLGMLAAHGLQSNTFTAGNAACTAIMNAAGTLETTAAQWQQFLMQQQAAMHQAAQGALGGPGGSMRPFLKN